MTYDKNSHELALHAQQLGLKVRCEQTGGGTCVACGEAFAVLVVEDARGEQFHLCDHHCDARREASIELGRQQEKWRRGRRPGRSYAGRLLECAEMRGCNGTWGD